MVRPIWIIKAEGKQESAIRVQSAADIPAFLSAAVNIEDSSIVLYALEGKESIPLSENPVIKYEKIEPENTENLQNLRQNASGEYWNVWWKRNAATTLIEKDGKFYTKPSPLRAALVEAELPEFLKPHSKKIKQIADGWGFPVSWQADPLFAKAGYGFWVEYGPESFNYLEIGTDSAAEYSVCDSEGNVKESLTSHYAKIFGSSVPDTDLQTDSSKAYGYTPFPMFKDSSIKYSVSNAKVDFGDSELDALVHSLVRQPGYADSVAIGIVMLDMLRGDTDYRVTLTKLADKSLARVQYKRLACDVLMAVDESTNRPDDIVLQYTMPVTKYLGLNGIGVGEEYADEATCDKILEYYKAIAVRQSQMMSVSTQPGYDAMLQEDSERRATGKPTGANIDDKPYIDAIKEVTQAFCDRTQLPNAFVGFVDGIEDRWEKECIADKSLEYKHDYLLHHMILYFIKALSEKQFGTWTEYRFSLGLHRLVETYGEHPSSGLRRAYRAPSGQMRYVVSSMDLPWYFKNALDSSLSNAPLPQYDVDTCKAEFAQFYNILETYFEVPWSEFPLA